MFLSTQVQFEKALAGCFFALQLTDAGKKNNNWNARIHVLLLAFLCLQSVCLGPDKQTMAHTSTRLVIHTLPSVPCNSGSIKV